MVLRNLVFFSFLLFPFCGFCSFPVVCLGFGLGWDYVTVLFCSFSSYCILPSLGVGGKIIIIKLMDYS